MSAEEQLQEALSRERRLVRALLLWATLLSLAQTTTLTLLFTWQKATSDAPEEKPQVSAQLPVLAGLFREFTVDRLGRCTTHGSPCAFGSDGISWRTEESKDLLKISRDGCYFLYVQVTIQKTDTNPFYTVQVKKHSDNASTVLLEHRFGRNSSNVPASTGFLGKQVRLLAGNTLSVTCSPAAHINTTNTATYFGFYLLGD